MIVSAGEQTTCATIIIALLFPILQIFCHLSLCLRHMPLNVVVVVVLVHCVCINYNDGV